MQQAESSGGISAAHKHVLRSFVQSGPHLVCLLALGCYLDRQTSDAEKKVADNEGHYQAQINNYQQLVEQYSRAKDDTAAELATAKQQLADIQADLRQVRQHRQYMQTCSCSMHCGWSCCSLESGNHGCSSADESHVKTATACNLSR